MITVDAAEASFAAGDVTGRNANAAANAAANAVVIDTDSLQVMLLLLPALLLLVLRILSVTSHWCALGCNLADRMLWQVLE